jgi:hypothetical protein
LQITGVAEWQSQFFVSLVSLRERNHPRKQEGKNRLTMLQGVIDTHQASLRGILATGALVIFVGLFLATFQFQILCLPLINGRKKWELTLTNSKKRYYADAKGLIQSGFSQVRQSHSAHERS